jgi:y4mF family transcriptional regulator
MKTPVPMIRIRTAEDLGRAVRERRKHEGLTLAEVAGLTNVGIRFLSELENGKPTVRLDKLLHVLDALGLRLHLAKPAD